MNEAEVEELIEKAHQSLEIESRLFPDRKIYRREIPQTDAFKGAGEFLRSRFSYPRAEGEGDEKGDNIKNVIKQDLTPGLWYNIS